VWTRNVPEAAERVDSIAIGLAFGIIGDECVEWPACICKLFASVVSRDLREG
jgi:hypothetical protein